MKIIETSSIQPNAKNEETMQEPFLFRFAKPCVSPRRAETRPDYFYDSSSDLVRCLVVANHPPAIEVVGDGGPKTKKCDLEKGEDNKDRRMW